MHAFRFLLLLAAASLTACNGDPEPDAYGNFEATETVVSAQVSGQLSLPGASRRWVLKSTSTPAMTGLGGYGGLGRCARRRRRRRSAQ